MKKYIIFILINGWISYALFAQNFNKRYTFDCNAVGLGGSLCLTESNAYMVSITGTDSINNGRNMVVTGLIDENGNVQQTYKTIEMGNFLQARGTGMYLAPNGGFVTLGDRASSTLGSAILLLCYDSLASLISIHAYREEIDTSIGSIFPNKLLTTLDKSFLIVGTYQFLNSLDVNGVVMKVDSTGNIIWGRRLKSPKWELPGYAIETTEGDYIVGGMKEDAQNKYHEWFVRISAQGTVLQDFMDTDIKAIGKGAMIQTPDSGFLCAGFYLHPETQDAIDGLAYVCKRDKNFQLIWRKELGNTLIHDQEITKIFALADGNYLVVGKINYAYPQYNNSGPYEGYVAKMTGDGQILWEKHYQGIDEDHPNGLPPHQVVYDAQIDNQGNILLYGESSGNNGGTSPQRAWLLKLDSEGCLIAGCNVGIEEIQPQTPLLSTYPNPAQNEITFRLATGIKDYTLSIYDLTSKQVYQGFLERETQVTTQTWAEGIYFYQVKNDKGMIGSGKFVIQH